MFDEVYPARSHTILVVDDQPGVRMLLREVFGLHGYKVVLASGGQEALSYVRSQLPTLILLDLRMPGMSGLETLEELQVTAPKVPVIIMTAVNDADAQRAVAKGAVCSISKPFDVYELRRLVDEIVASCVDAAAETSGDYREQDEGEVH